jgi:hypothetical protein
MRTPVDDKRVTPATGVFPMGAFLFEETFAVKASKVTVVRPICNQPFSFRINSSTVLTYAIHFIGAAFVCPGEETCPACGTIGKRSLSMLFAGSHSNVGILEVGQSTMGEMVLIQNQHSLSTLCGTTWSFVRRAAKRPLIPTLVSIKDEKPVTPLSEDLILQAFAKLFSLAPPPAAMSPSDYSELLKPALALKLERALIR